MHPERYALVENMAADAGCTVPDLVANEAKRKSIDLKQYVSEGVGLPTLQDQTDKFIRKLSVGDIRLPLICIDASSQKSAKGVHILDLAQYIDNRREAAFKEVRQLAGEA